MGMVQNGKWPNNQAGCSGVYILSKFGKLINGQDEIRAGRVSNFSEINKRACLFRQVRVMTRTISKEVLAM